MDINYEANINEGRHLKTLHKLNNLSKNERIPAREDLRHLFDGYIFYLISTYPSSPKEILKQEIITD